MANTSLPSAVLGACSHGAVVTMAVSDMVTLGTSYTNAYAIYYEVSYLCTQLTRCSSAGAGPFVSEGCGNSSW